MTNTDRLAQEMIGLLKEMDRSDLLAHYEALASLAPATVEGDAWNEAALFVNNCENALDESTKLWRRVTSGEGHDMVAFQTPVAHAMQQCLRNARKVVLAVKENTAAKVSALAALVSEIGKTAFHQREQGMREMPDLLESYANRIAALLSPAVCNRCWKQFAENDERSQLNSVRCRDCGMATHALAAFPALTAQVAALTAQCEGLRKDAERYRWLRGNTAMTQLFSQLEFISHGMAGGFWPDRRMKEELDAAIDAASAAGNGEGV